MYGRDIVYKRISFLMSAHSKAIASKLVSQDYSVMTMNLVMFSIIMVMY